MADRIVSSGFASETAGRRWVGMHGEENGGRFVLEVEEKLRVRREAELLSRPPPHRLSYKEWVGHVCRTTSETIDMEVNVQLGEFTLRTNRMQLLDSRVVADADFLDAASATLQLPPSPPPVTPSPSVTPAPQPSTSPAAFTFTAQPFTFTPAPQPSTSPPPPRGLGAAPHPPASHRRLHCAVHSTTIHRTWLHLLGSDLDVQLWSAPPPSSLEPKDRSSAEPGESARK